jgi:hypothetical protein
LWGMCCTLLAISGARRKEETKVSHEPERASSAAKERADLPRLRSDKDVLLRSESTWLEQLGAAGRTGGEAGAREERVQRRLEGTSDTRGKERDKEGEGKVGSGDRGAPWALKAGQGAGAAAAAPWQARQAPTTR